MRTEGSGWGGGPLLYQLCPKCGKKKAYYSPIPTVEWYTPFKCTSKQCKKEKFRFASDTLVRKKHA